MDGSSTLLLLIPLRKLLINIPNSRTSACAKKELLIYCCAYFNGPTSLRPKVDPLRWLQNCTQQSGAIQLFTDFWNNATMLCKSLRQVFFEEVIEKRDEGHGNVQKENYSLKRWTFYTSLSPGELNKGNDPSNWQRYSKSWKVFWCGPRFLCCWATNSPSYNIRMVEKFVLKNLDCCNKNEHLEQKIFSILNGQKLSKWRPDQENVWPKLVDWKQIVPCWTGTKQNLKFDMLREESIAIINTSF